MSGKGPSDEGPTRQTGLPDAQESGAPSPDSQATGHIADLGMVAELRAAIGADTRGKQTLPLYALPDQIVVGRGSACDWQIDDASLSRKHAQFRWNGKELTVEDLGSANGTRVSGRPARTPLPVQAGEPIQLGTVIVTFEWKGAPRPSGKTSGDEVATRLVAQPFIRPEDLKSDPGLPALPPQPTVVRTPAPRPSGGTPVPHAAVFRPPKDFAGPDEPTRSWDPHAALVKAPERAFDGGELLEQWKRLWREKRRMVVLAGATAWMAILLMVWASFERRALEEDPGALPSVAAPKSPKVTQLDPPKPPGPIDPPAEPMDIEARDQLLLDAVTAYEQGRQPEALALFKKLAAADLRDPASQFMVELLSAAKGAP